MYLRVGDVDYEVTISGPGRRTEIFLQGCYQDCPGCFNQSLRPLDGGRMYEMDDVLSMVREHTPNKLITICGGEPLIQAWELAELTSTLQEEGFHVLVYTGLTYEEITQFIYEGSSRWSEKLLGPKPHYLDMNRQASAMSLSMGLEILLTSIDILVDGPFELEKILPIEPGKFIGSSNQRAIDMPATLSTGTLTLIKEEIKNV